MLGFNTAMNWKIETSMIVIRFIYWNVPKKKRECCGILRFSSLYKFLIPFPETDYAPNVCIGHFIAHNIALSAYLLPLTCLIYIFSTLLICMESPHLPSQACHRDQTSEFIAVKANSLFGIQMFASLLLQMPGWQAHLGTHRLSFGTGNISFWLNWNRKWNQGKKCICSTANRPLQFGMY